MSEAPTLKTLTRGKVDDLNALEPAEALNTALYALALQLGYPVAVNGDPTEPKRSITADMNDVLHEALEVIQLTEQMNFNRGNAVKYIARAGLKDPDSEIQDLEKAAWYINREIARLEGNS